MLVYRINETGGSVIVMHTRQHKAGQGKTQLPLVFNAIEKYEKKIWLCARAVGRSLKPTMSIDAPRTI